VLRGGGGQSNYSKADIAYTKALLDAPPNMRQIMIDCSHGNSNKNFMNQPRVFDEVVRQFASGEDAILGSMLESNLVEGKQELGRGSLVYGQSITDGCVGWETTAALMDAAYKTLS
jgi:3-deoxy-7-phosphoheptulonate synthase